MKNIRLLGTYLSINIILSTTLVLFIFGLCGLLVSYTFKFGLLVKQNAEMQVFLDKALSSKQILGIKNKLNQEDYVLGNQNGEAAVEFISKEKAAREFVQASGEDFRELLDFNPLRDAFVFKLKSENTSGKELKSIQTEIESWKGVFEVSYTENMMEEINQNIASISIILLVFGFFILLTVMILIDNTLKISIFSQRLTIRSMQLVGATDWFIQKPFLIQALVQGALSGVFAGILLYTFVKYMESQFPELSLLYSAYNMFILVITLLLIGSLISSLSTYRSIYKYLSLPLDRLH